MDRVRMRVQAAFLKEVLPRFSFPNEDVQNYAFNLCTENYSDWFDSLSQNGTNLGTFLSRYDQQPMNVIHDMESAGFFRVRTNEVWTTYEKLDNFINYLRLCSSSDSEVACLVAETSGILIRACACVPSEEPSPSGESCPHHP